MRAKDRLLFSIARLVLARLIDALGSRDPGVQRIAGMLREAEADAINEADTVG